MVATQLLRAADFLNGIGVDTHIPYTDGGYVNISNVLADLNYLGITQVRDGVTDGAYGSAPLTSFIKLAQAGIRFTVVRGGGATTTADLQAERALLDRLNTAVPGSVVAVEGVNEINNQPVTFNGLSGQAGAVALQQALYSMVHADPALAGTAVDYFTGYSSDAGTDPDPSTTPGLADYDTQHPYPRYSEAPGTWVDPQNTLPNEGTTKGPFVYTETGYSTYGDGSVSEDVQAKYTLDLLLDATRDGAAKTYLYQLMDAYAPGSRQGDDGFGLFGPGNVAKPAAVAIHNLTTILADTGATAASFTPSATHYSLSGLPATGNSLAIAKSSGIVDIAVWAEPEIWNAAALTETAAPTTTATMTLGASYDTVSIYDPLAGSTPVQVLHSVSTVQLALTDHPLIVQLSAGLSTDHAGNGMGGIGSSLLGTYNPEGKTANSPSTLKPALYDFNGDGRSDLLWQSRSNGNLFEWAMNGSQAGAGSGYVAPLDPVGWQSLSTGDFNGDGKADLLWRDSSGNLTAWFLNGTQVTGGAYVGTMPTSQYTLLATDDFNDDGKADLLWQDKTSGALSLWDMNGAQVSGGGYVATMNPGTWQLAAHGDFSGDGKADLLWENRTTGDLYLWDMNGNTVTGGAYVATMNPSQWSLAATGDFNGDGKTDLLWQDRSTGDLFSWDMDNAQVASRSYVATMNPAQWSVADTGDFTGSGKTDLLWQDSSAHLMAWTMNDAQVSGGGYVGTMNASQWLLASK